MRPVLIALCASACAAPAPVAEVADVDAGRAWSDQACGSCHAEEAESFAASAHARSFTGRLFADEWGRREDPFCVPCHAPLTDDPWAEPERAARGVACEACHVRAGRVRASTVSGEAPHPSVADPELRSVRACAGCHQIDFPRRPGLALQNTVAEWHAAGEPGGACQTCHMPEGPEGTRRHDFPGGHDPSMLADALEADAVARPTPEGVRLTLLLRASGAGHAVPTGDIFRRLVVRAWPLRRPTDGASVELGRHLGARRWYELRDDRVPPPGLGARKVELLLPGDGPVGYSVAIRSTPLVPVRRRPPPATPERVLRSGLVPAP